MSLKSFQPDFRDEFDRLLRWRRDVRHFTNEPVEPALIDHLLAQAMLAPSVGFSQPWRWVKVESVDRRQAILLNFAAANLDASSQYESTQAEHYRQLKLAGLAEAPVHLAVFADLDPVAGSGLGRQTMPATTLWSVVMAIHTLWLAARIEGLGLGWVSILDPQAAQATLDVPAEWTFVAYLCVGWPAQASEQPLLERERWQARLEKTELIVTR